MNPSSAGQNALDTQSVLERVVLADLLDDSILAARPGDKGFPLRVLFGELGARISAPETFTLACGLNFFFRSDLEDEERMRVGYEVSRLYYRFVDNIGLDAKTVGEISPLLAALLGSQLRRLGFESVDHVAVFDSRYHERAEGSDGSSARVLRPLSFVAKVMQTGMVRLKARVMT